MFAVYADGQLLHDSSSRKDEYYIFDPVLTIELNKAGSFEFSIAQEHPLYDELVKLRTTITIFDNDEEIFRGRILEETLNFYNNKKIMCEGELAFLNDILIEPYAERTKTLSAFITDTINYYSDNCSDFRKIKLGTITTSKKDESITKEQTEPVSVFNELTENILNKFGGYFLFRTDGNDSYLDYVEDCEYLTENHITFSENLLDMERYIDSTEFYTCILPLGASDDEGNVLTISTVNNGVNYIETDRTIDINGTSIKLTDYYGKIVRSISFDDIDSASELKTKAEETLNNVIDKSATITVSAVDLRLLNPTLERIEVGKYLHIRSPIHSIDTNYICSKAEIHLFEPENTVYTLGTVESSLSDNQAMMSSSVSSLEYSNSTSPSLSSILSNDVPRVNNTTAVAGTSSKASRADHVHPTDTSRAAFSHTHSATDITSNVLPAARGGTGESTLRDAFISLVNSASTGSTMPEDNDYYIAQYTGGGTTTTSYHRKKMSTLWSYIKTKTDSLYLLQSSLSWKYAGYSTFFKQNSSDATMLFTSYVNGISSSTIKYNGFMVEGRMAFTTAKAISAHEDIPIGVIDETFEPDASIIYPSNARQFLAIGSCFYSGTEASVWMSATSSAINQRAEGILYIAKGNITSSSEVRCALICRLNTAVGSKALIRAGFHYFL